MKIRVIQFGEGKESSFLAINTDTEEPLFEVKFFKPLAGYAFGSLADIFKRILAKWKRENMPDKIG